MTSKKDDVILLDVDNAHIREASGSMVQCIPKRWVKRRDLKAFFQSDLEIALERRHGKIEIVIRVKPREDENGQP